MAALQRLRSRELNDLLKWYQKNHRPFPWRVDPRPYWIWLAEIMSQQTQMATLVPYFHRFIERFPTIEALAKASDEDVLAAWTGLGYYSRARNVHKTARRIVGELGGKFPLTLEECLELPGVGPYTAAALVSQLHGVAEPVWDGNVRRVCSRLDARADALTTAFRSEMTEALRKKMGGFDASHFNQALMELGATVCTPKSPACGRCPLQVSCRAYQTESVQRFPPPKERKAQLDLRCNVWVLLRPVDGGGFEAFLQKRTEESWFPGMWDFPSQLGGAQQPKVANAPDYAFGEMEAIGRARHQITHHRIELSGHVHIAARKWSGPRAEGKWFGLTALTAERTPVPLSTTARKIIKLLGRFRNSNQAELFG